MAKQKTFLDFGGLYGLYYNYFTIAAEEQL